MAALSQLSISLLPGTGDPSVLIVRPGRRERKGNTGLGGALKKNKKHGGSSASCAKSRLFPNKAWMQLTNLALYPCYMLKGYSQKRN